MAKISVTQYQDAIVASHGILAAAARRLEVSRTAVHKAVKRHPTLQAAVDEARDEIVDLAETRLYEKVHAGHTPSVMFVLSTLGKDRGYVPRQEIDQPRMTPRELEALSDEALAEHARELGLK